MKTLALLALTLQLSLLAEPAHATSYWIYRWAGVRNAVRMDTVQTTIVARSLPDKIPWAQIISYVMLYNPDLGLGAGYAETGLGWSVGGSYCRNLAGKKQAPIDATCIWYADETTDHRMTVIGRVRVGTAVTITLTKNTNNTVTATYTWTELGISKKITRTMNVGGWYSGIGRSGLSTEVDTNSLYNSSFWQLPADAKPGNVHMSFLNTTIPDPAAISFWSSEPTYFNNAGISPYSTITLDVE